jgi:hypothetical protein
MPTSTRDGIHRSAGGAHNSTQQIFYQTAGGSATTLAVRWHHVMSNRRTQIQHQSRRGDRFQVTAHETDSPILPVAQLRDLSNFRPDLVDWVITRSELEGEERRKRQRRLDRFVFIERVGGLLCGAAVALFGLGMAGYIALHGHDRVATILGGGTLVAIVSVMVGFRKRNQQVEDLALPKIQRQ